MSPRLRLLLAASFFLAPLTAAAASVPVMAGLRDLYRLDLATASAQRIGAYGTRANQPIVDLEGLAYSPRGDLYGVSDAQKALFRVDPATGLATFVGDIDAPMAGWGDFGLAFTCDGRAWLSSDVEKRLWEIDTTNGTTRVVAELPMRVSGLAGRGNTLHAIAVAGPEGTTGAEGIYRIDPATGSTARLAGLPVQPVVVDAGLDFDASGRLWATLDYNPPPDENDPQTEYTSLAEFDPATGALLGVRAIAGPPAFTDLEGLALSPPVCGDGPDRGPVPIAGVPLGTPPMLALLAALIGAVGLFALRRRRTFV